MTRPPIRPAEPTDGPVLRALQSELLSPWPELLDLALHGPGPLCLVAERSDADRSGGDDRVVGYVLALAGDTESPSTDVDDACHVVELVVAPEARREGYGSALLDAVAERVDADRLRLTVRADDDAARAFYEHHGFTPVERLPDYYAVDSGTRPQGGSRDGLLLEKSY